MKGADAGHGGPAAPTADFERLGVFYLGRERDLDRAAADGELLLYDAKDLVTHAVCVGMTGSGKTGLGIGLLEEAAIDGIPAIVIDPKGDLANLLLTFPELRGADFRPWVDPDAARRASRTPDEFAEAQAAVWRDGLARSGQDGARIARLRAAADVVVHTPGSTAGFPVSILSSLAAPPKELVEDAELFQERVASTATSLLGLIDVDADPLQSREHILLATILARAWREGRDVDLAGLIHALQDPPVARIGVLELEAFYPAKERFQLALRLNGLLASPSFATWLEGEPLDVGRALHTESGKPRIAIYSIAHLSDAERMFFVALLLNQTLAWVRQQPGTSSLRALLYMDEIHGYFPPVANPPSKAPLLTLLKQARAFGLGVVLSTQNPVDLDYKGLANCGTWFLGRLQTERDKLRVLDGLEGASASAGAGFDRASMDQVLSRLGKRTFLMSNVHDDRPVVFETRWTLSYLRGPMTRAEIKALMDPRKRAAAAPEAPPARGGEDDARRATAKPTEAGTESGPAVGRASPGAGPAQGAAAAAGEARPVLPPVIAETFLPVRTAAPPGAALVYAPALFASARVYYSDAKLGVDMATTPNVLAPLSAGAVCVAWDAAGEVDVAAEALEPAPRAGAAYEALPPEASKPKSYDAWKRSMADHLYRTQRLVLLRSAALGLVSRPGESERDFRVRLREAARERGDEENEKLRAKYAPKLATLQERLRRAQQAVEREKEQAQGSKASTLISFGVTLLGAFTGRKTVSAANAGRAASTARSAGRAMKEAKDVERAGENVAALEEQLRALDAAFQAELAAVAARLDPEGGELEELALKPKKTNVGIQMLALAWAPCWRGADGAQQPAWPADGAT
jgi:hypothetical protein